MIPRTCQTQFSLLRSSQN